MPALILEALTRSHDGDLPVPIQATRLQLAQAFARMGYRCGAEIGVEEGYFSETLCRAIPGLTLYGVDPWMHYAEAERHRKQEKHERMLANARERLAPFPGVTLMRMLSTVAAPRFEDGSLDFVYIDANHAREAVAADILAWEPKVRRGGIVSGHDYCTRGERYNIGVIEAVQAYTAAHAIRPWFTLVERGIDKKPQWPSWFWVKR